MVCDRPLLEPRVVSRWMGPTPARASTLTKALPARQPRLRNLGPGGPVCSGVSSPPIATHPECPLRAATARQLPDRERRGARSAVMHSVQETTRSRRRLLLYYRSNLN